MAVNFDVNTVTFRCKHAQCGEVFEKCLDDLVDADEVFCPRCGTPARVGGDMQLLVAARAASHASVDKTTG